MPTKQFVEKQIALEKYLKSEDKEFKEKEAKEYKEKDTKEYKDVKDKEKEKEKEKETVKELAKDKEVFKEHIKEFYLETVAKLPQAASETAAEPAGLTKTIEHKQIVEKQIYKEFKVEKYEIKEGKFEAKEIEKPPVYEGKLLVDGPYNPGQGGDPYAQRIAALESTVAQLVHFIPAELRPDLSQGALKQEPDAAAPAPAVPDAPKDSKK